jgi:hypothetical protein
VPQFPVANLLGQPYQQQLAQSSPQTPYAGMTGGQYGQGQLGPFLGQSGDAVSRILPYLAQQGLAQQGLGGQGYGMARVWPEKTGSGGQGRLALRRSSSRPIFPSPASGEG